MTEMTKFNRVDRLYLPEFLSQFYTLCTYHISGTRHIAEHSYETLPLNVEVRNRSEETQLLLAAPSTRRFLCSRHFFPPTPSPSPSPHDAVTL